MIVHLAMLLLPAVFAETVEYPATAVYVYYPDPTETGVKHASKAEMMRDEKPLMVLQTSRSRKSLAALGPSLMGISKIADNPPGAKEQREFEQKEKERQQQQEMQRQLRIQEQRREQPQIQRERQMSSPQKQPDFREQPYKSVYYDPDYGQLWGQQRPPQAPYDSREPVAQDIIPQFKDPYGLRPQMFRQEVVPQAQKEVFAKYEAEPPVQYIPRQRIAPSQQWGRQPFQQGYVDDVATGRSFSLQNSRFRRSIFSGLNFDISRSMGLQDSLSPISEGQIKQDIGRSDYTVIGDQTQSSGKILQPYIGMDEMNSIQSQTQGIPKQTEYDQPKPEFGFQQQIPGYEPSSAVYGDFKRQMPLPDAGIQKDFQPAIQPLPQQDQLLQDRSYQSNIPIYGEKGPMMVDATMLSKTDYVPSDQLGAYSYQQILPEQQGPEMMQQLPATMYPSVGSEQFSGAVDTFDREFNYMPQFAQMDFDKSAKSGIPSSAMQGSLEEPQRSLSRQDQLGGSGQGLQEIDSAWR